MTDRSDDPISDGPRPDHSTHDVDLVASYASSELDDAVDETRVADWIETCQLCRTEFETQNHIAGLLSRTTVTPLTEVERNRLHTGVLAGLDETGNGATIVDLVSHRQRRWLTMVSVAAVSLTAVIGLGSLIDFGGDGLSMTTASGSADATLMAPTDGRALQSEMADTAPAATDTTQATFLTEATTTGDDVVGQAPAYDERLPDPQTFESLRAYLAARIDTLQEETLVAITPDDFSASESSTPPCWTDELGPVYRVVTATVEDTEVVVFIVGEDPKSLEALVYQTDSCIRVDLDS